MSQQQCLPLPRRRKRDCTGAESGLQAVDLSTMNAMSYMESVNLEASLLPDVFVAPAKQAYEHCNPQNLNDAPIDGSAAASNYLLSNKMHIDPPPTQKHLPRYTRNENVGVTMGDIDDLTMNEWISSTLSNFSSLRVYIKQCHTSGIGRPSSSFTRMHVPMSKDRVGWHTFCLGRDEARGNVGGYFQDDEINEGDVEDGVSERINDDDDDDSVVQSNSNTREMVADKTWDISTVPLTGYRPNTTLLCQFDQIIIRRVLSHHAYYLSEDWRFTEARGRWIYALLSRLEKPLHWDETSMLRGLLRALCRLRADMNLNVNKEIQKVLEQKKKLSMLNVLITVIGIYFEQGEGADYLMAFGKKPI